MDLLLSSSQADGQLTKGWRNVSGTVLTKVAGLGQAVQLVELLTCRPKQPWTLHRRDEGQEGFTEFRDGHPFGPLAKGDDGREAKTKVFGEIPIDGPYCLVKKKPSFCSAAKSHPFRKTVQVVNRGRVGQDGHQILVTHCMTCLTKRYSRLGHVATQKAKQNGHKRDGFGVLAEDAEEVVKEMGWFQKD